MKRKQRKWKVILTDSIDFYKNGTYGKQNPSWHQEHSVRKAHELYAAISSHIQKITAGRNQIRICEIGCGYGGVLYHFSSILEKEYGIKVEALGIDLSAEAVGIAKKAYGDQIRFFCGDVDDMEERVDIMLLADVVEHVEDAVTFLKRANEKSKWLLVRFPLENNVWNILFRKKRYLLEKHGHLHFYTFGSALRLLEKVGGLRIYETRFTRNFMDPSNCTTFTARLMKWPRFLLSAISPRANSIILGGQSLVAFGTNKLVDNAVKKSNADTV